MLVTTHQFIDKYPIDPDSEKLIVGTIHPHYHEDFKIPFFYGNVNSLWQLLSDAFPDRLKKPVTLEGILTFLKANKISVSDTIRTCGRKKLSTADADLIPLELNYPMLDAIKKSSINELFFTSGFGKNNAFKLFFCDMLKQRITSKIKADRGLVLDSSYFGRPVKLTVLYAPSGAANIAFSRSKFFLERKHFYATIQRPVYACKVAYYREMFKINCRYDA